MYAVCVLTVEFLLCTNTHNEMLNNNSSPLESSVWTMIVYVNSQSLQHQAQAHIIDLESMSFYITVM